MQPDQTQLEEQLKASLNRYLQAMHVEEIDPASGEIAQVRFKEFAEYDGYTIKTTNDAGIAGGLFQLLDTEFGKGPRKYRMFQHADDKRSFKQANIFHPVETVLQKFIDAVDRKTEQLEALEKAPASADIASIQATIKQMGDGFSPLTMKETHGRLLVTFSGEHARANAEQYWQEFHDEGIVAQPISHNAFLIDSRQPELAKHLETLNGLLREEHLDAAEAEAEFFVDNLAEVSIPQATNIIDAFAAQYLAWRPLSWGDIDWHAGAEIGPGMESMRVNNASRTLQQILASLAPEDAQNVWEKVIEQAADRCPELVLPNRLPEPLAGAVEHGNVSKLGPNEGIQKDLDDQALPGFSG